MVDCSITKPKILIVEDNPGVLFNLKMTLEFNNYNVISASNGIEGLQILEKLENPPDLIISDIMMPEMDGYEFFKEVSNNPRSSLIPFIFLSAKATVDDIRFGKMLGVSDYIAKPYEEEDLLSSVKGKIARNSKIKLYQKQLEEKDILTKDMNTTSIEYEIGSIYLFFMVWDELQGPKLEELYPTEINLEYSIKEIGIQLFQSAVSIYGQTAIFEAKGILLDVLRSSNFKKTAYIYFDSRYDPKARGNEVTFMLVTLAPRITYFHSLKLSELFKEIATKVKDCQGWNKKFYLKQITDILTTQ